MPRKFKLKIVEGKTAADLEQKVDLFVQELKGGILNSRYQRTARDYLAFIEYEEASSLSASLISPPSLSPEATTFPKGTNLRTVQEWAKSNIVKTYLQLLYERHGGNISHIAKEAGVSRYHMRSLLRQYELHKVKEQ